METRGRGTAEPVGRILARLLARIQTPPADPAARDGASAAEPAPGAPGGDGRYDFDLAEFPLFSFCKPRLAGKGRDPLVYTDTITGRDGVPVTRT